MPVEALCPPRQLDCDLGLGLVSAFLSEKKAPNFKCKVLTLFLFLGLLCKPWPAEPLTPSVPLID